jgi:intracellular sulfur oxidation DsrE/DsrF family protein
MNRSSFLAASATVAAATSVTGIADAQSVPGGSHFVERKADFDMRSFDAKVGRAAEVRQLWEAVAFKPAVWNNVKNAMNGLQFGFGYPADSIAMAWCGHGPSAVYGYSDYVWSKYQIGTFFGLKTDAGVAIESNVYLAKKNPVDRKADPDDASGMYQDASVEMLQERGLAVLTCHTAVEEQSRNIVKAGLAPSGMTPSAVADDILTHLIPGAIVVPSMVAAIAVLQQAYRYTYITLTF